MLLPHGNKSNTGCSFFISENKNEQVGVDLGLGKCASWVIRRVLAQLRYWVLTLIMVEFVMGALLLRWYFRHVGEELVFG